jgi:hypothetical protein
MSADRLMERASLEMFRLYPLTLTGTGTDPADTIPFDGLA